VHVTPPTDEITSREALAILGLKSPSTISRLVDAGDLTPSRRLVIGRRGTFLFWRHDVERLAARRAAEAAA
jgi:hypothetical protein